MVLRPGIHLLHKPVGVTSFSLVQPALDAAAARGGKRLPLCHGGTLDPFARGLVLLLVGNVTKLMDLLHEAPKVYVADVAWGTETDNGDPTGAVTARGDAPAPSRPELERALAAFLGWTEQVPPATSAKKVGGEPAYRKAHRGEAVLLPPSRVFLLSAGVVDGAPAGCTRLELTCRGGYYVRALARDLGRALGCRAHVAALHRSAIGPWHDPGEGGAPVVEGADVIPWAGRRMLTDAEVGVLRAGGTVPASEIVAAPYRFPPAFPPHSAPTVGLHLGRATTLLRAEGDQLRLERELRGGL